MNMVQFVDSRIGSCFFMHAICSQHCLGFTNTPFSCFLCYSLCKKKKRKIELLNVILHMTTFVLLFLNRESDKTEEDGSSSSSGKRQLKLSSFGVTTSKRKSEEIGSSGKSRCKFFQARKLEQLANF